MKREQQDARIPTSVTKFGAFTVKVYDEEAYRANIARYYGESEPAATHQGQKKRSTLQQEEKKKTLARFKWARGFTFDRHCSVANTLEETA